MKKIAFINPFMGYPVPSTMGGGVEELLTNLLNENEKTSGDYKFYFVQRKLYGKDKKFDKTYVFKNSEIVKVGYNRPLNFLQRVFSKCLKCLKIKKNFPTYFPLDYHNKTLKKVKKINPDIIIFESQIDANNPKYQKIFGKDKLFLHLHIQDLEKVDLSKFVAGTISVSNFVKTDYENFLGENAKTMQNFVLQNCIDEERFSKSITIEEKSIIRKNLGFADDDFVVVFCGRICPEKGVIELCNAILKAPENIKLLIIGGLSSAKKQSSPYIRTIAKIADKNPEKIKFTGYIKNSELYKYYNVSNLQVVPSTWEEAAGLVAIEGQMCGMPQIITNSGGMPEFASKDGTVIVEKDGNLASTLLESILTLSSDPEHLKKMSASSIVDSSKFNKQTYYKNFVDILNKIFKEEK